MKEGFTTESRAWSALVLAAALVCLPLEARAQATSPSPQMKMAEDSAASHIVALAMIRQLGLNIPSVAADTASRPWKISFPIVEGSSWPAYREQVLRVMRGRNWVDSDSTMSVLSLRELRMRGDTLVARFYIGYSRHCDGTWKGGGTVYLIRAIRLGIGLWSDAVTDVEIDGDSIPCSRK